VSSERPAHRDKARVATTQRSIVAIFVRRTGVLERSETDRDVRPFDHEVLPLIREHEVHAKLRVPREELRETRSHGAGAEEGRQGETNRAAQAVDPSRDVFRILQFRQDVTGPSQECRTGIPEIRTVWEERATEHFPHNPKRVQHQIVSENLHKNLHSSTS